MECSVLRMPRDILEQQIAANAERIYIFSGRTVAIRSAYQRLNWIINGNSERYSTDIRLSCFLLIFDRMGPTVHPVVPIVRQK